MSLPERSAQQYALKQHGRTRGADAIKSELDKRGVNVLEPSVKLLQACWEHFEPESLVMERRKQDMVRVLGPFNPAPT